MKREAQQRENVLTTITLAANTDISQGGIVGNAVNRPSPLSCGQWERGLDNFH